jgi:hypothetical protein
MPRKLRLTPLQRDILWLLEEAGEETLGATRASLSPSNPETLDTAIRGLVHLGFVTLCEETQKLLLTDEGRRVLTR